MPNPSVTAFALALDGRIAKTPAKHDLVVPTRALAEAVAGEWQAQGEKIDFAAMPLTRPRLYRHRRDRR